MRRITLPVIAGAIILSCSGPGKIESIRTEGVSAQIVLPGDSGPDIERRIAPEARRDTLKVKDLEGNEVTIMRAVRDEETGEMVATETLDAAVITARFRNVAERHGKIDLRFDIIVPEKMQDLEWQLRFHPDMFILGDSTRLDALHVTGANYRKAQLRGYQQYEKFLSTIISDTTRFIDLRNLEIFIERNLPEIYALRQDSSFVSDESMKSLFGVTEKEAIDHYTRGFMIRMNERRIARREAMYRKYVKVPISGSGIRLDTVIRSVNGDFIYEYVQTIQTRPKLRKVDIVLSGDIYKSDEKLYTMSRSEPLSFYISSISSFTDNRERYLTEVIERRVEAKTACYVDFASGKADIDLSLGHNETEVGRIRDNVRDLLEDTKFDLDSIVITASASPEGSLEQNNRLSERRADAVGNYFRNFIDEYRDSLRRALREEGGFSIAVGADGEEDISAVTETEKPIPFRSHAGGENWKMLDFLVSADTVMTSADKEKYLSKSTLSDIDERERSMQKDSYYKYMRQHLYPRLRTVRFDFHLLRKGMVKDTVHTTVPDSAYMRGVALLRDREYDKALPILRPYADFNTAVCYVSLDMNRSAMALLEGMERTANVNYLLALLHYREGDDRKAVECYLHACAEDPSLIHRGNLDPEISAIIHRYGLDKRNGNESY